jgi:hypothetical protein
MVQIRISQKKMMDPRVSNLRFARAPRTFTFFFAISIAIALFTPMNFVIITPGDPSPLFPKILSINDSSGSDEYNRRLSEQRAESVKAYAYSQGISFNRLTTEGRGETEPIADNSTAVGKAQNRRVEIVIVANETMKQEAKTGAQ